MGWTPSKPDEVMRKTSLQRTASRVNQSFVMVNDLISLNASVHILHFSLIIVDLQSYFFLCKVRRIALGSAIFSSFTLIFIEIFSMPTCTHVTLMRDKMQMCSHLSFALFLHIIIHVIILSIRARQLHF